MNEHKASIAAQAIMESIEASGTREWRRFDEFRHLADLAVNYMMKEEPPMERSFVLALLEGKGEAEDGQSGKMFVATYIRGMEDLQDSEKAEAVTAAAIMLEMERGMLLFARHNDGKRIALQVYGFALDTSKPPEDRMIPEYAFIGKTLVIKDSEVYLAAPFMVDTEIDPRKMEEVEYGMA